MYIAAAMLAVSSVPFLHSDASAQVTPGCDVLDGSVLLNTDRSDYEVYVRHTAPQGDIEAMVALEDESGQCSAYTVDDVHEEWAYVATISASDDMRVYGDIGESQDYGSLEVLLVPRDAVTSGVTSCVGRVQGCERRGGYSATELIIPAKNFSPNYVLSASVLIDRTSDAVQDVMIYSGSTFVRSKDTPIDYQVVDPQTQHIYYDSGQLGIVEHRGGAVTPSGMVGDILRRGWVFVVSVSIVVAAFICIGVSLSLRWRERRRQDRQMLYADEDEWKQERGRFARLAIYTAVAGVIFVVGVTMIVRVYIFDVTTVRGVSMEPQVSSGTRMVVNKAVLLPRLVMHVPVGVERGDRVFIDSRSYASGREHYGYVLKRVVGVAGDTVHFTQQGVWVEDASGASVYGDESMSDTIIPMTYTPREFKVDTDEVFVLGDNRPASIDSRTFGPIYVHDIRGVTVQ